MLKVMKTDTFWSLSLTLRIWQTMLSNISRSQLSYGVFTAQSFPTCRLPQEDLVLEKWLKRAFLFLIIPKKPIRFLKSQVTLFKFLFK